MTTRVELKLDGSGVQLLKLSVAGLALPVVGNRSLKELPPGRYRVYFCVLGAPGADFTITLVGARCIELCGGGTPEQIDGEIGDDGDCRSVAYIEVG